MNHDEVTANLLAACEDPFSLLSDEVREWIKQMVARSSEPITDDQVQAALTAWFANTKDGWSVAMRAALEATRTIRRSGQ